MRGQGNRVEVNCTLASPAAIHSLQLYFAFLSPSSFTLTSTQPLTFREANSILEYRPVADASGLALPKQFYIQVIDADLGGLKAGFIGQPVQLH